MKAVVLEVRGREAAVLLQNGTVRRMRGRYEVGEKLIVAEETQQGRLQKWIAAAAAVIVLMGVSGGYLVDQNLVGAAEVSLDVNPSIVYTLNRRDRVLSVKAANDDAENIVEALQDGGVRFAPIAEAVEQTLTLLEDEGYLSAEAEDYVLLNVSSDSERVQEALSGQVETALENTKAHDSTLEYRIDVSDRATAKKAAEHGMSAGRYQAWKKAAEEAEDGQYAPSMDDFVQKPVREILRGKEERGADEAPAPNADEMSDRQSDRPEDQLQSAALQEMPRVEDARLTEKQANGPEGAAEAEPAEGNEGNSAAPELPDAPPMQDGEAPTGGEGSIPEARPAGEIPSTEAAPEAPPSRYDAPSAGAQLFSGAPKQEGSPGGR